MKHYSILAFVLMLSNFSCSSYKGQLISKGNSEDAIQNAIIDFSSTSLFKKGKVFNLYYKSLNDNHHYIMIIESFENKYLYSKGKKIEENKLPSRCLEYENKLFIWWDDNYIINAENFNKLDKYHMLKDDDGGWLMFTDQIIDDKKKGVNYFICKNNLKIYKRVITSKGVITTPKIKCE